MNDRVDINVILSDRGTHAERAWMRFLWSLTHVLQPKIAVEIGTGMGASTRAIALAMHEIKQGLGGDDTDHWPDYLGHLFSIDPSEHVSHVFDRLEELGLSSYVTRIKDYSERVGVKTSSNVDLLIIDGNHYYVSASLDFASWVNRVNNEGIVVFHDMAIVEVAIAFKDIVVSNPYAIDHNLVMGSGLTKLGIMRKRV